MGSAVYIYGIFFFMCLISPGYLRSSRHHTFRCHDNKSNISERISYYISESGFCNGWRECIDREDEDFGCEGNHSCGEGKFACDSNQCKNITVRCDTIKDCQDETDELDCGDEVHVKNCTSRDKFLCKDGLRCLELEFTCDGYCNCFDCSDENDNCTKHDDDLSKKCPRGYFVFANGPQCLCDLSNKSRELCNVIEDCSADPTCEQRCMKFKHREKCSCFEGFYRNLDESHYSICKPREDFETVILYSNDHEIISLNKTSLDITKISNEIASCTSLTAANDFAYCATSSSRNKWSISKTSLKSGKKETIVETDLPITSIAVDYVTNNVYFTSNGSLSVCSKNGEICTQLKCCGVQYVALAPKFGWMFYAQSMLTHCQNGSVLTRSNMDGSDEIIFSDDLYHGEITLAVDESEKAIHLLQNNLNKATYKAIINKLSFDSVFKKIITSISNIQSYGVYNDKIFFKIDRYYMKGILHTIARDSRGLQYDRERPEIKDLSELYFDDNSTSNLTALYVYNSAIQRSDENPCEKSSCSGLCLVKQVMQSEDLYLNCTCVCDKFVQKEDNRWCSNGSVKAADRSILRIVTCILMLIFLAGTGYYIYEKRNWHGYYLEFREWRRRQSTRDQSMAFNNREE